MSTLLSTVLLALVVAPAVGAQSAPEPPGFVPGEAQASADTVSVGLSPGGGKPITFGLGSSIARYQNRTATSQGSALSLGLLEVFLGPTSQCGDLPPIIPAEQLPPVTTNDSRRNAPMLTPIEVRSPGEDGSFGGLLGTQIANASASPQVSSAQTTTDTQDYGVLALDGGRTEVSTKLEGGVREATAVVTGVRLRVLSGMVVIHNPRWQAIARSGAVTTAEGSFTFSSASMFGIERTPEQFEGDFAGFADGLAKLLSGLGLMLDYPKVVIDGGSVTVTPLTLGLQNPPLGLDFIQPLLKFLQPFKDDATRNAIAENCNNEAKLQILDLMLGVLSGTGAMTLGIGGVEAFTAATEFPEPPALDIGDLSATDVSPTPTFAPIVASNSSSRSSSSSSAFSTDTSSSYDTTATYETAVPVVDDTVPLAATATKTTEPEFELPSATTVASRFEPGRKGGPAIAVGLLGLLGLAGLALADRFVMRRTRREIPD